MCLWISEFSSAVGLDAMNAITWMNFQLQNDFCSAHACKLDLDWMAVSKTECLEFFIVGQVLELITLNN